MNTEELNQRTHLSAGRRFSRRKAMGYGGVSLAASALATGGLAHVAGAQDATPAAAEAPGATPERVAAAVKQLDSIIAGMLKKTGVPGLAIAVVHQDKVVYLKGFGERELGGGEAVDADTVFQLASVSKCLASTTVAAAVGDGVATWNTRVNELYPAFEMYDSWVTHEVTVADLFSHRSGLVDHLGDDLEDLGYDRAAILRRIRHLQPEGRFRDHYAYTNFGLTAAAVAVASAAGETWEDLSKKRLYQPAGMTSTSSLYSDFDAAKNKAHGHMLVNGAWIVTPKQRQPDAQSPAGGVSSSARDLGQWLRLILGEGTLDGKTIVDATALKEAYRPRSSSSPAKDPAINRTGFYGLGWTVSYDGDGRVRIGHSGAFGLGAGTAVSVIPSEQLALAIVTNGTPVAVPEAIANTFFDLALTGTVSLDYLAIIRPFIDDSVAPRYGLKVDYSKAPADPGDALPLTTYTGDFTNDFYGDMVVSVDGEALTLHLGPDLTPYPMRHFAHDVFLYQPVGENAAGESAVSFAIGAGGSATTVTIEILDLSHQGTFIRPVVAA